MSIKDWFVSQLVSKSLASTRPLLSSDSLLSEEPRDEEFGDHGSADTANLVTSPVSTDTSCSSGDNHGSHRNFSSQQVVVDSAFQDISRIDEKLSPVARIEALQIKFFRLLRRFGLPQDNLMVSKVLYRIHLATLIRAGEPDLKRPNLRSDRARVTAAEQEASGSPELDFSFKILVLGKTGVGKSSTINSVFGQSKAITDAFQPATNHIQEVVGTVNGIKISFIDTPGLLPSESSTIKKNRKILHSVKRFVKKSPPDMVLYFDRLDLINMGYSDFPLLKLISEVFGPAIWFNTVLVMTHSSCTLPEGPNGRPVSYESYVNSCTDLVQHYIHQAVSDTKLKNPLVLVENHPHFMRDNSGQRILPNGQAWKSQFFLLCLCTKVLGDVNSLLELEDSIRLGPPSSDRLPSLPHLLSSFLKHHTEWKLNGEDTEIDEDFLSGLDEEEDYDKLPPIQILTKSRFSKLTDFQKKEYLDELDYRETLYLKKQLKEEYRRRRENKISGKSNLASNNNFDNQQEPSEPVLLPDMALPPNFDSDSPVHRYRCLVMSDDWLARPVLDPHGFDHDVSFDGVNLEAAAEVRKNIFTCVKGQVSKDKQDLSIQSECAAAFVDPNGPTYSLALDIQSAGKELVCTVHSNTMMRNFKRNVTECGVAITSFGNKYFIGTKLEDSILIGRRLKVAVNAGRMGGAGQVAYGGAFEATLRGKDYPVRNDKVGLGVTVLSFRKETVLGTNMQYDFRLSRHTNVSLNANMNSRKMGQVSVKTSSSDHMELALIAVFSILRSLLRRKSNGFQSGEPLEAG